MIPKGGTKAKLQRIRRRQRKLQFYIGALRVVRDATSFTVFEDRQEVASYSHEEARDAYDAKAIYIRSLIRHEEKQEQIKHIMDRLKNSEYQNAPVQMPAWGCNESIRDGEFPE